MLPITELVKHYNGNITIYGNCDNISIDEITADSRKVISDGGFVAVRGTQFDGTEFISDALNKGVKVIVSEDEISPINDQDVCYLRVDNARKVLSLFSAALYGPQPAHMVAVTGTDGKTSTAEFFRQLMEGVGKKVASIGTLGVFSGGKKLDVAALNTTPDPVLLHKTLRQLKRDGCEYGAIEASSHGLHQYRLDGIELSVAAFTNLASDHLDYHGSHEEYFAAKKRLFSELLPQGKTAILNCDDDAFSDLEAICNERNIHVITFGSDPRADLCLKRSIPTVHGQDIEIEVFGESFSCKLGLVGRFQVMNILAALGMAHACGLDIASLVERIPFLKGAKGRLEKIVEHSAGAGIYVDFAHTADALEKLLKALRQHTGNRLVVVFGCGGDRDKGKRSAMGKVAASLADIVIVTDDNPRSEDPEAIRKEVMSGCPDATSIGDRKDAIGHAITILEEGDVLVVAGKGHESVQIIGEKHLPFNDADVICNAIASNGMEA